MVEANSVSLELRGYGRTEWSAPSVEDAWTIRSSAALGDPRDSESLNPGAFF